MLYQETREGGEVKIVVLANLFRGIEAVGGVLRITEESLAFQPHPINIQRQPLTIPIAQIEAVWPVKTLGFVDNGMMVRLHDGKRHQFVVWNRDGLIALLQNQLFTA